MSRWYSCTFAAIGSDRDIKRLAAASDNYWHRTLSANYKLSPGFVQIQVAHNYGGHDAAELMVGDFPQLTFIGSLYVERDFGNDYLDTGGDVDQCQWWRFHGSGGAVEWQDAPGSPKTDVGSCCTDDRPVPAS